MGYQKSCYVNGSYPLLEFLLMDSENDLNETFFFFGRGISSEIAKNFKNSWHLNTYFKKKNKFTKYFEMYFLYKKLEKFLKKEKLENKDMYMQDNVSYSQFFLNHIENCFLLEDGYANYNEEIYENIQKNYLKTKNIKIFRDKFLKRCKNNYMVFGLSSKINKIYLTGLSKIPSMIENKVELVNIKEIWKKLDLKKKEEIMEKFNFKNDDFKEIVKFKEKILLITQPLSEDKIITEEEKIKIYREIIEKYSIEKIIIKPHPREETNYKLYFPNVEIIKGKFPLEILSLMDITFKEVITLFSTAALNFKGISNVNFLGTIDNLMLEKKFGKIREIYYKI